jgi:hypothetical protein
LAIMIVEGTKKRTNIIPNSMLRDRICNIEERKTNWSCVESRPCPITIIGNFAPGLQLIKLAAKVPVVNVVRQTTRIETRTEPLSSHGGWLWFHSYDLLTGNDQTET